VGGSGGEHDAQGAHDAGKSEKELGHGRILQQSVPPSNLAPLIPAQAGIQGRLLIK
jgi:hypothetical protein